jgi:hypothetical protein
MAGEDQLLNRLDGLTRTEARHRSDPGPRAAVATGTFADLLRLARAGELTSLRPVDVSPEIDLELSDIDRQRLAWSIDRAEIEGAQRAFVLMDGRGLVVDVPTRRIESVVSAPGDLRTDVDAVVVAPDEDGTTESTRDVLLAGPGRAILNHSLRDLLAGGEDGSRLVS